MKTSKNNWWNQLHAGKKANIKVMLWIFIPIIVGILIYTFPIQMANAVPIRCKAKITCVSSNKYWRFYDYDFVYKGEIYHGIAKDTRKCLWGDVGDTVIIRLNKFFPKYNYINVKDNPPEKHKRLSDKEYKERIQSEPNYRKRNHLFNP